MTPRERGTSVCATIMGVCAGFIIGASLVTMMWVPWAAPIGIMFVLIGVVCVCYSLESVLR